MSPVQNPARVHTDEEMHSISPYKPSPLGEMTASPEPHGCLETVNSPSLLGGLTRFCAGQKEGWGMGLDPLRKRHGEGPCNVKFMGKGINDAGLKQRSTASVLGLIFPRGHAHSSLGTPCPQHGHFQRTLKFTLMRTVTCIKPNTEAGRDAGKRDLFLSDKSQGTKRENLDL